MTEADLSKDLEKFIKGARLWVVGSGLRTRDLDKVHRG